MLVNEGKFDRLIRIVTGIFLLSLLFWGPRSNWAYLGLIPLLTGIIGICPLYRIFGWSTCPYEVTKN